MRFSKEIKALAKKIAKAEFDYAREMYKEDVLDEQPLQYSEREYVDGCAEHVSSLIADEVAMLLAEAADEEYNRLVKAKYGRRK